MITEKDALEIDPPVQYDPLFLKMAQLADECADSRRGCEMCTKYRECNALFSAINTRLESGRRLRLPEFVGYMARFERIRGSPIN